MIDPTSTLRGWAHSLLLLSCILPAAPALAQADKISPALGNTAPRPRVVLADRIVAVVNDEVITMNELAERLRLARNQLGRQNVAPPPDDVLERQVLERLIIDRAQLQFARENAIRIDDVQLDRTVGRIAEENRMTMSQFRDVLERDGIPFAKFREDVRNDILISRVREREVDSRVAISEGEVDNFIAQSGNSGDEAATEISLAQILVRVPENATPEQLAERRKRADEALAQLRGGAGSACATARRRRFRARFGRVFRFARSIGRRYSGLSPARSAAGIVS